jgi:membrane peptidoglycan carboxypeptidase
VARAALDAARCPVGDSAQLGHCSGSTASNVRGVVGHPVFGKTGTTDKDKTAALIAGTTSLVVAGYMVNPDYQNHSDHMSHPLVNTAVMDTLRDYMKGKPKVQFKVPGDKKISEGDQRSIPDVTCQSIDAAKSEVEGAGFDATVGGAVDSNCPAGTAADTNPSGRTEKGGVVVIEPSKGGGNEPGTPGNGGPGNGGPGNGNGNGKPRR